MNVGDFIRERRQAVGISQIQLGDLMPGWHQPTVWKTENCRRPLRFDEAAALASLLQFDLADLAALVPTPDVCVTCWGKPPAGFRCNECERSSAALVESSAVSP